MTFYHNVWLSSNNATHQQCRPLLAETDMASTKDTPVILWFRSDLRLHDNEALVRAVEASDAVIPVYCFDPRIFGKTYHFGFPKTGRE
jgi:hypothetical protein